MLVFVLIGGLGLIMVIATFLFGGDTDADMDSDVGGDGDGGGPSVFSVKMLSLLMTGFGVAGFAARVGSGTSMGLSSLAGAGGAVALGLFGWLLMLVFYRQQASSTVTRGDVLGSRGRVIDRIGADSQGQITCVLRGQQITYLARSSSGEEIAKGTLVEVKDRVGNTVYVEPVGSA